MSPTSGTIYGLPPIRMVHASGSDLGFQMCIFVFCVYEFEIFFLFLLSIVCGDPVLRIVFSPHAMSRFVKHGPTFFVHKGDAMSLTLSCCVG